MSFTEPVWVNCWQSKVGDKRPSELAQGKNTAERVSARHTYWRRVQERTVRQHIDSS